MKDYRLYLLSFIWIVLSLFGIYLLFQINIILSIIYLVSIQIFFIYSMIFYFTSIWWPQDAWLDKTLVEIQEVEIPSNLSNETLKGLLIRSKVRQPEEKQIGILYHHGYLGNKESKSQLIYPLALYGYTILSIDARGHGNSISKNFNRDDFIDIFSDVKKEIDFLEKIDGVDPNRLVMIGHSMGGTATLTQGFQDTRLKKIIALAAPFNHVELFKHNKTFTSKLINNNITKGYKEDLDKWNKLVSAEYFLEERPNNKDRVYLIYSKNDDLVLFDEALKIKEKLKLPDENTLFLEKPDNKYWLSAHMLIGQETTILSYLIKTIDRLKV